MTRGPEIVSEPKIDRDPMDSSVPRNGINGVDRRWREAQNKGVVLGLKNGESIYRKLKERLSVRRTMRGTHSVIVSLSCKGNQIGLVHRIDTETR